MKLSESFRTALAGLLILTATTALSAAEIKVVQKGEKVVFSIDGEHFTTFNYADSQAKPYFHPIYAPGKTLVVREQVFNKDGEQGNDAKTGMGHFHHKGLWIAIDTVNEGLNYWHEGNRIENVSVKLRKLDPNSNKRVHGSVLEVVNHWLDADEKPLIKETSVYTITPDRIIACDLTLSAIDKSVTFGDTKEGLFAIRVAHALRGLSGGEIVNADGAKGEKEAWGRTSPWVDYYGEVDGKTVGVSLFDDPKNFRPSRYHVRAYGLFAVNPFGESKYTNGENEAAPVTLEPGDSLNLRYGLYVHDGDTKAADVAETYQKFVNIR
ncbi:DUF6807 domain-containing protein [Rubinisphaera margarita]|uniref:DUF6807 domain-containing protein n=1 Tax=Rubinisphaera margarita TaxID=2909586 RepID=UPI001EE7DCC4|nr:PmoA family protein [Rubinisphaera margarita]MCG6158599.1 PmoA family protein [Rubinisphaera margarita]